MAMHSPRLLLIGGLLVAASAAATAQTPPGAFAEACRQNARQFCAAMAPGPGMAQCLRDHQAQLTAGCAAAVAREPAAPALATYAQAAVPEAAAPAYPVPQPAPVYPAPEAAAPGYPAQGGGYGVAGGGYGAGGGGYGGGVMAAMQTCRPDLQVHCAGVQPGGGRIAQCLKANFAQLSPVCRQALLTARAARQGGAATAYAPRY